MKNVIAKVETSFIEGAILENSWGWEQTNIDFYCIIKRSGEWVTVLPMTKNEIMDKSQFLTGYATPVAINYNAKPIRKKIQNYEGKESGFSFGNYSGAGWCSLWNGQESMATHYA